MRCFEAACDAALDHEDQNPLIVNAMATFYMSKSIHTWCEVGDQVYDYTLQREPFEKESYYQMQQISDRKLEYSLVEGCKLIIETGTHGPLNEGYFLESYKSPLLRRACAL